MSKPGFTVERGMVSHVPGAFIAFGPGVDVDRALDAAVTVERFDLGTSGSVPSLADLDPAATRHVHAEPVHPYVALDRLLALLPSSERGELVAQAVTPMSAWKHEKRRVKVEGVEHTFPDAPGLLLPVGSGLRDVLVAGMSPEDAERFVGAELLAEPRRRYKVKATSVKGPRKSGYAVFDGDRLLEIHPTGSTARKAAVLRAKAGTGAMRLSIRPWIGRNDDAAPYVTVERAMVVQRAAIRVHLATEKRPENRKCAGWIFAGRLPR